MIIVNIFDGSHFCPKRANISLIKFKLFLSRLIIFAPDQTALQFLCWWEALIPEVFFTKHRQLLVVLTLCAYNSTPIRTVQFDMALKVIDRGIYLQKMLHLLLLLIHQIFNQLRTLLRCWILEVYSLRTRDMTNIRWASITNWWFICKGYTK